MKLPDIIRAAAARMSDVCVNVDTAFETVSIGDDVFMQGGDAANFIAQARDLYEEAQTVSMADCYACVAEPYACA